MCPLAHTDPVIQAVVCPAQQDQANLALRCVLDAEIEALKDRLRQRSAEVAVPCGLAQADQDCQTGWLQDSLTKLQARRDALR
jgi:hypothetical protein